MKRISLCTLLVLSCYAGFLFAGKHQKHKLTRWEYTCFEWFCEQQQRLTAHSQQKFVNVDFESMTQPYGDAFDQIDATIKAYVAPVFAQTKTYESLHIRPEDICRILLRVKIALDQKKTLDSRAVQVAQLSLFDRYHT